MRLIPSRPAANPGYWCTWQVQSLTVPERRPASGDGLVGAGDQGNLGACDWLDEQLLFAAPGWLTNFADGIRGDLWALLDHGWDLPRRLDMATDRWRFGACEPDGARFPSLVGTPGARLRALADRVRAAGWRGLGLWIGAQAHGDKRDGRTMLPAAEVERLWRERARWSHAAGVGYWKVDWGLRDGDVDFRLLLTRIAAEEAPGLLVEHAPICGPFNDLACPWHGFATSGSGRFRNWDDGRMRAAARRVLAGSDVYRSYDVTAQLSVASTIDRLAELFVDLVPAPGAAALVNCEDELYLGAALGCALGIMRHPLITACGKGPDTWTEAIRAVRWQRVMAPFGAGEVLATADPRILTDTHAFRPGDSWASWLDGTTVAQAAPARLARGLPLPTVEVDDGPPPFVVCARHPGGPAAVATLPRRLADSGEFHPRARVTLDLPDLRHPVAAFGHVARLTLRSARRPLGTQVWIQDLAGDDAVDATGLVTSVPDGDGGWRVDIPGELVDRLGTSANHPGDASAPGVVIALR